MKYERQASKPSASNASAAPAGAAGGSAVQLRKSLRTSSYEEGRSMVSPDANHTGDGATTGDGGATGEAGGADRKPKDKTVILSAKAGGSPFTKEFWTDLDVGHCWVDIRENGETGRRKDSWGYTAKNVSSFPVYQPWKTVDGEVLHPDGSRGATGTLAVDVDEDQLKKGEQWAEAAGSKYNLFGFDGGHSCATFAKGFFETATGQKAPTGMFGALIANPNDLSAAMNKKRREDREKNPEEVPEDEDAMA